MSNQNQVVGFELSVSGRDDGTIEAAYFRFKKGKVARTAEIVEDTLIVDYDAKGNLLGIEVLAPVQLSDLAKLVEQARRRSFRKFVRHSAPQELIHV